MAAAESLERLRLSTSESSSSRLLSALRSCANTLSCSARSSSCPLSVLSSSARADDSSSGRSFTSSMARNCCSSPSRVTAKLRKVSRHAKSARSRGSLSLVVIRSSNSGCHGTVSAVGAEPSFPSASTASCAISRPSGARKVARRISGASQASARCSKSSALFASTSSTHPLASACSALRTASLSPSLTHSSFSGRRGWVGLGEGACDLEADLETGGARLVDKLRGASSSRRAARCFCSGPIERRAARCMPTPMRFTHALACICGSIMSGCLCRCIRTSAFSELTGSCGKPRACRCLSCNVSTAQSCRRSNDESLMPLAPSTNVHSRCSDTRSLCRKGPMCATVAAQYSTSPKRFSSRSSVRRSVSTHR
mmetsp:Transcript_16864/g.43081  ORF Transcript_16864/g.43081 Transcript_16864/m.43081 type:complete len:369 (-) Transcript_16864:2039-3145(-)